LLRCDLPSTLFLGIKGRRSRLELAPFDKSGDSLKLSQDFSAIVKWVSGSASATTGAISASRGSSLTLVDLLFPAIAPPHTYSLTGIARLLAAQLRRLLPPRWPFWSRTPKGREDFIVSRPFLKPIGWLTAAEARKTACPAAAMHRSWCTNLLRLHSWHQSTMPRPPRLERHEGSADRPTEEVARLAPCPA